MAILRGGGLRREEAVTLDLRDLLDLDQGQDQGGATVSRHRKGRQVIVRTLTPQAVWFVLKNRAVDAGVNDFSPHDFRRTFISELLDAGVDIVTVQQLAGHAAPTQTSRYDRHKEETLVLCL